MRRLSCFILAALIFTAPAWAALTIEPTPGGTQPYTLIPALATGTSSTLACSTGATKVKTLAIYITGSSGVSSGAVTIETAATAAEAGTWAPLAVVTVVATTTTVVQWSGTMAFVRARVTTTVVGGTVTVLAYAGF
jgi:hypothetical protein